jgi:hypothetical protein
MDASKDLFEPAVTSEFLGANFVLMIDVILLDLNPVVAEAAAKQVRPCNVIFRGDEQLEARFAVVGMGGVSKSGSSLRAPWMPTIRIICRSGWVWSLASGLRSESRNAAWHSMRRSQAKTWGAVSMVSRQEGHESNSACPMHFTWCQVGSSLCKETLQGCTPNNVPSWVELGSCSAEAHPALGTQNAWSLTSDGSQQPRPVSGSGLHRHQVMKNSSATPMALQLASGPLSKPPQLSHSSPAQNESWQTQSDFHATQLTQLLVSDAQSRQHVIGASFLASLISAFSRSFLLLLEP